MAAPTPDLDLFTPVVPKDRWHPNYDRIQNWAPDQEKQVLRDWSHGFRDRDGKFVKELQTTFNPCFWELYLYALLKKAGCVLDQSHARPDFVITGGPLGEFTAEAVIASNPQDNSPEWSWDPTQRPPPREVMLDLACLRLTQAILSKHEKWIKGYSSLSHCQGKPFIVCVGPFEQPWASLQGTEAIDRVLFQGPRPVIIEHDNETVIAGYTVSDQVFKASGANVPLGLFNDARLSTVSAVLFSSLATYSKVQALSDTTGRLFLFNGARLANNELAPFSLRGGEYAETLEDGAHLFINPFAATPIDPAPFFALGLGVHQFSPTGTITAIPPGGLLVNRVAVEVRSKKSPPGHKVPPGLTPHTRKPPPDDVPFAGPSRGPITDEITLELHRGWTLLIGRDMVDHDWAVQAKHVICLSLEQFVKAPTTPEAQFMTGFFPTREEAVTEARRQIDAGAEEGGT